MLGAVARPVLESATVRLNTRVSTIHGKSAVDAKVKLDTLGGQTLDFDEVVVTAPLGWLKQNLDAFDPPLPDRLSQAIGHIGYGCLEKVYLSFPEAFWLDPGGKDDRKVEGFCQWLAPKYSLDTNPKRWTHEVVELGSLQGGTAHPTLLFYIYGEQSQLITSSVRSLDPQAKHDYLCTFFRPYYTRLPHYEAHSPRCQPTSSFTTDWLGDDMAGNGSYSNFQIGLLEGDKDIRVMRKGVPDMGIWLAGEHTAPFVALGTVTGAYWSGESVGRRIAEAYGKRKKPKEEASNGKATDEEFPNML